MTKPQWLKDRERKKDVPPPITCATCVYFGRPIKEIKWKGKERCVLHECSLHPGCLNTKFSVKCGDYQEDNLI